MDTVLIIMIVLLSINSLCLGISIGILIGNNSSLQKIAELKAQLTEYEKFLESTTQSRLHRG